MPWLLSSASSLSRTAWGWSCTGWGGRGGERDALAVEQRLQLVAHSLGLILQRMRRGQQG